MRRRAILPFAVGLMLSACSASAPTSTDMKALYEQDKNATPGNVKYVTEPVQAGTCYASTITEDDGGDTFELTLFARDGKVVDVLTGAHDEQSAAILKQVGC